MLRAIYVSLGCVDGRNRRAIASTRFLLEHVLRGCLEVINAGGGLSAESEIIYSFPRLNTASMSDKRRAEIEAKRAKLAELRKARADRQRAETERRQSEASPCSLRLYYAPRPASPLVHPPSRIATLTTS